MTDQASCTTADCRGRAVRYVSCEGEGSYPYCQECTDTLLSGGHEDDHGPVDDPLVAEVERLRWRLLSVERALDEVEDYHDISGGALAFIQRALDEERNDG